MILEIIKAPLHDPVSMIYDLCYEGRYRKISALLRPVLAAELGVEYVSEPKVARYEDGREIPYEFWRIQRAEARRVPRWMKSCRR